MKDIDMILATQDIMTDQEEVMEEIMIRHLDHGKVLRIGQEDMTLMLDQGSLMIINAHGDQENALLTRAGEVEVREIITINRISDEENQLA
jgi:hypothetical protein